MPRSRHLIVVAQLLADGAQLDHPKVHPHWETRQVRYVFATMGRTSNGDDEDCTPEAPQRFACVDVQSGAVVDSWSAAGSRRLVDEAVLIPKSDDRDDMVSERDAWLVAPVFDGVSCTTTYIVLDGAHLSAGPLAEIPLPTHIPWALHGSWVSAHCKGGGED